MEVVAQLEIHTTTRLQTKNSKHSLVDAPFLVHNSEMEALRSPTVLALMLIIIVQAAEPSFATSEFGPQKTFEEQRLEMLELDLSMYGRRLSPYQRSLIHFWRGEYLLLLDVDTFIAAFEFWKQRDPEVTADLYDLFDNTRRFYIAELVTLIQDAELSVHEKEFLELFLFFILNEGESRFMSVRQLNGLADKYLSTYSGSPYYQFIQSYIETELPPVLWTFGSSLIVLAPFLFGSISDYFSLWVWGLGFDFPVSYRNIVIIPSATIAGGSTTTPFSYDGANWNDTFGSLRLDLSLGYRINLSPRFFITPKGGLGLLNIWEHPESETDSIDTILGFTPTASIGIAFEYLSDTLVIYDIRLAFGVDYRYLINAWEDRFQGSELILWVGVGLVCNKLFFQVMSGYRKSPPSLY